MPLKLTSMPMLYKGAGPGTHWSLNDARLVGFNAPVHVVPAVNQVLSHINTSPQRSPCISFTSSFAIAREYALFGPTGPATKTNPGFVYCIDLGQLAANSGVHLIDPLQEIAGAHSGLAHSHNGASVLIEEIARAASSYTQANVRGGLFASPAINPPLLAMVRALRDAELLAYGSMPKSAVIDRDDVF